MLGCILKGGGKEQQLFAVHIVGGMDANQRHPSGGHGAGLVEDNGVDLSGGLKNLRTFDQDPEFGAATSADEQGSWRGQAQGARAGDDQNGDRCCYCLFNVSGNEQPSDERHERQAQHDGDEDGRDAVGQPLNRSLPRLRSLDEACHLRQRRVCSDARGANNKSTTCVHRGANYCVTRSNLSGDRFAQ